MKISKMNKNEARLNTMDFEEEDEGTDGDGKE